MNLRIRSHGPAGTVANVRLVEGRIGVGLPTDYAAFLMSLNGCRLRDARLFVEILGEQAVVDVLLGVGFPSPERDVFFWIDELADDVAGRFLPIGFDPGGNAFLLDLSPARPSRVFYWDSARWFEASTDEANTYESATSFADFLARIDFDATS